MPLLCHLYQLEEKALQFKGELSVAELELEGLDPMIQVPRPVAYDLEAQLLGQGILVKGSLHVDLECQCVRCLKSFELALDLEDWLAHLPLEGEEKVAIHNDCVDLTPIIREDILLAFPQHPLCKPECRGLSYTSPLARQEEPGARRSIGNTSAWAELNKLKL